MLNSRNPPDIIFNVLELDPVSMQLDLQIDSSTVKKHTVFQIALIAGMVATDHARTFRLLKKRLFCASGTVADYAAAHHLIPKRGVNVKNILLGDLPDGIGGASAGEGVVSHLVHCGEEFPAVYAVLRERGYLHRPA